VTYKLPIKLFTASTSAKRWPASEKAVLRPDSSSGDYSSCASCASVPIRLIWLRLVCLETLACTGFGPDTYN